MTKLGKLGNRKPIESAIVEIKKWLDKIQVNGIGVDIRYDAPSNIALLRFTYKSNEYEFISKNQSNCRLNMWAIAQAMESKVRNHIMQIEPFAQSMTSHLRLESPTGYQSTQSKPTQDVNAYATLGISPLCSNQELLTHYKKLAKAWHPDMAGSEEAKEVFEKKISEINQAWENIKKERQL